MKIGIQVSSLKPMIQSYDHWRSTCEKIAALGCDTVQLQWLGRHMVTGGVAKIMGEFGIRSVSVQDFYTEVAEDTPYFVRLNHVTHAPWLCVSRIPDPYKSPEGLDRFIRELRAMQESIGGNFQQKLCFHPVSGDFYAVDGMDAVGYLLEQMPELALCLDLYHLNRCCDDMPGFIRKYAGRIPMVHFKDEKNGALVPAGQGDVNWNGVVKACLESGVEYGFVEQERWEKDPFQCLKEAMDWLRSEIERNR